MGQDDIASQWKSFDDAKRDRLLKKMSPEQKKILRGKLEVKTVAATPPTPDRPGLVKSFINDVSGIFKPSGFNPYPGMGQEEKAGAAGQAYEQDQARKKAGYSVPYRAIVPVAESIGVNVLGMEESARAGDVGGVKGHALAPAAVIATGYGVGKGLNTVGELRNRFAPVEVPIGGENVPALVGEAHPETLPGRIQVAMKRGGGPGGERFNEFTEAQQAKVKQVIRNVAQQTSGAIGPMAEEPGKAMSSAADATFEKASPMYQALDESLVEVPDGLSDVSKVTQAAITRAKKWGVELPDQEWNRTNPTTPIQTYMKVRSELLKMQRSATDAAQRYAIGNDLATMNANMESAIGGTPLGDSWHEASRLWSKGYAIRDVADAFRETTEGTPAAEQAPGLSKIPTKTKGASLVSRLNDLKQDGILDRGFTPEEVRNLRQSADILDRASATPGAEFGWGYGVHSSFWRNAVKLPGYPLVRAMTTTGGVNAIRTGNFPAFAAIVSASGIPKSPGEARDRARQLAPQ